MDVRDSTPDQNKNNGPEIGADNITSPIGRFTWAIVALLAVIVVVAALFLGGMIGSSPQESGTGAAGSSNRSPGP